MHRKIFASRVFERQVALISGGCSSVGRALATRLAQAGAHLAILDLDPLALDSLIEHLADHHNAEALGLLCDVTDVQAVERAVALVGERFGGIDLLACCAAVGQRGTVLDTEPAVFRQVMAVNFFGALHCARAALPSLLARRGQIVVAGALSAFTPLRLGHGAEAASRQALLGLFEALRLEVAPDGVNVMLLCPGSRAVVPDSDASPDDGTAGRRPSAQDIAEAIFQGALRRRHLLVLSSCDWRSRLLARLVP
ncbi:SDR family oxidoreductase [Azotobacter armeniacus]